MLLRILTMKKFWQLAAIMTLAAIPILVYATKQSDEKQYHPHAGDDPDIFDQD